jgi:translation initiation factor 3 subunit G
MSTPRWGDDLDDSDDENQTNKYHSNKSSSGGGGLGIQIPPTQKSRIDSNGIQIVTSYRLNPSHSGQLLKTVTKVKVTVEKVKEPLAVAERRLWKKFGQAAIDEKEGVKTTTQSKDEILLEDPNADTDLQEEDATATFGNLNAFWALQQKRQLMRKYEVSDRPEDAADGAGWTQVGTSGANASGSGGATSNRYIPPSLRAGMAAAAAAAAAGGPGSSSAMGFQPERRVDDLNTIRVTNLSGNTTEADLQELFEKYGRISRVYLAKDKETLQSRGFAFVSFVSKDDAARAMNELQGYGYDHLILKLEWARPNAPKDPASSGTEFRSGYGKALAQDTKEKVSFASNLTK